MLKQVTTVFMLMANAFAFSQVGIQTATPRATLDVVGNPTNVAEMDGILAPRITGAQLRAKTYTSSQIGALVYVTTADTSPAGQTIDVTKVGYFYFNGSKWVSTEGNVNIYNSDGALTDGREVDMNGNDLRFEGSEGYFHIYEKGSHMTLHGDEDRAHFRFSTADLDGDGVTSQFDMDLFQDNYMQMFGSGEMGGISFGTHYTQDPSPIELITCPGGNVQGETRVRITGEGNVGIDETYPSEKLDIGIGNLRVRDINTNAGSVTDNIVVADSDGVFKTLAASSLTTNNIYNSNGTLTANRTVTTNSNTLRFSGNSNSILISNALTEGRLVATGTTRGSLSVVGGSAILDFYTDNNSTSQIVARGNSTSLNIATQTAIPLSFNTNNSEKMRILSNGNVGVATTTPTEKFQVTGIARFASLPSNGATNAIFTTSGGGASSSQDQTFTATRTLVADANGVLGAVTGLPLTSEVDGVIGNEVTNATTNGGLVRAGSGTSGSPYTLGLTSGTTSGDVMTWNGTQWTPTASLTASNGLTLSSNNIKLGGTLTENTTITETDKTLTFNTTTLGGNKFISNGTVATPKAAIQVRDGNESTGRVLTSDSNGNATWQDPTLFTVTGTFSSTSVTLPASNSTRYTNASITLPPGKWMVNLGSTVSSGSPTAPTLTAGSIWVTYTLQDTNTGTTEATTADYITTYSGNRAAAGMINIGAFKCFVSGVFAIQNSGTTNKTYYVWVQQERNAVAPATATVNGAMASSAWERYFYAIRIQ